MTKAQLNVLLVIFKRRYEADELSLAEYERYVEWLNEKYGEEDEV